METAMSFIKLISKVTHHHFCHILLMTQINHKTMWKGSTPGVTTRRRGVIGHHLEAVYRHNKTEKHNAWTNDKSVSRSNYVHLGWKINE